ncbi:MAG: helix-turn-helix transcriptional regulator [Candidatus Nanopelagicales bacterium]
MSQLPATSIDALAATGLRQRRDELSLTQGDVAEAMGAAGWTPATVTQVESGRRKLSASEAVALAYALAIPLVELLIGNASDAELVSLGKSESQSIAVRRGQLRESLLRPGKPSPIMLSAVNDVERPIRDEERKLGRRLGSDPKILRLVVRKVYGHSLAEERDKRIPDAEELAARSLQAKRGRVMREIEQELRQMNFREVLNAKRGEANGKVLR